ncbi:MAG: glycosyltransferase family 4 protein [Tistlia sp.]|uniref:glycosyltransferase family 4 protein n=1 Tax=Tistlia sp. TaxID=3057121 RepID=UPI0034A5AACF
MAEAARRPWRRLLHVFSTFDVGGPQIRFVQLVRGLGDAFEHQVLAMNGENRTMERLPAGAPVELVPFAHDKGEPLRNLWRFRRRLAALRPDLLVTYNWGAVEWGLVNALAPVCPHVDVEDGFGPEEAERPLPRRTRLRRFVYGRARCVVVPSRTLQAIARDAWGLPDERLIYLPNGIRTEELAAPPDRALLAAHGLARDEPVIGTLAALRPEKNLGRLLEAFRLGVVAPGRPGHLAIIGDGPERAALEARASKPDLAGRVTFTGYLDRPGRLLGAMTAYAISSDTEQMPISLVEAMAAGLPVASTDVGDVATMVAEGNRRHVRGREAGPLAESLAALLDDPAGAAALGAANRERARQEFAEDVMVERYRRIFSGEALPTGA